MIKKYAEFSNNVKMVIGQDSFNWAARRLHRMGGKNLFIITDQTIKELGHVDVLKQAFEADEIVKFSQIYLIEDHSPNIKDIEKLYLEYRRSCCDGLIAFGGSRVLNSAKALALLLSTGGRNIEEYTGIDSATKRHKVPFGIVSTTFGSGKEVSRTCVIIDEERKMPLEIVSDALQPDFCVLSAEFLKTLPNKEIYLSVIDVLAYDIESYISLRANELSRSFVKTSMFMIRNNLQVALKEQQEEQIYSMQRAAAIAGIAYSNTYIGLIHAIGHAISAKKGIQHCVAICCVLAESLRYLQDTCAKEYGKMLLFSLGAKEYATLDEQDRKSAFVNIFDNLVKYVAAEFDIPIKLSEHGVMEEELEEIASLVIKDGALITCPKTVTKEDIIEILRNSL